MDNELSKELQKVDSSEDLNSLKPSKNGVAADKKEGQPLIEFISLEALPTWFAVLAGLFYATGFLIEFTFLNSMGIQESVIEVFKAKYIYVGLLCLQLPVGIGVLVIGYFRLRRQIKTGVNRKAYLPTVLLIINLLIAFYFLITFCDPDFFHKNEILIGVLFGSITIGIALVREIEDWSRDEKRMRIVKEDPFHNISKLHKENGYAFVFKRFAYWFVVVSLNSITDKVWKRIRWGILIVSVVLTTWIFEPLVPLFWQMLEQGAWLFLVTVFVAGVMIWWIESKNIRGTRLAMVLMLPAMFAYLSVIVFAYRIYPYIAVERGGGDFSRRDQTFVLFFDKQLTGSVPQEILSLSTNFQSKPLTVLDETPDTFFVSTETSHEAHVRWRKLGVTNKPAKVFAIKSKVVTGVAFGD
jgi:hypothetical protein